MCPYMKASSLYWFVDEVNTIVIPDGLSVRADVDDVCSDGEALLLFMLHMHGRVTLQRSTRPLMSRAKVDIIEEPLIR